MSIVDTSRMWVRGPLPPFMQGFARELRRQGYKPHGARNQLRPMSHLSRWLERTRPAHAEPGRYRASDRTIAFLEAL